MKILRWWKTAKISGYSQTMDVVPLQEITSDDPLFPAIVDTIKARDFSYELIERVDRVLEERA